VDDALRWPITVTPAVEPKNGALPQFDALSSADRRSLALPPNGTRNDSGADSEPVRFLVRRRVGFLREATRPAKVIVADHGRPVREIRMLWLCPGGGSKGQSLPGPIPYQRCPDAPPVALLTGR
jgi:hypothetical protein